MIGTRISATVWQVSYRFKPKPEPERRVLLAGEPPKPPKPPAYIQNVATVLTADPSGGDLADVTRLVVLGPTPHEGHDFAMVGVARVADAMGLATVDGTERQD